MGIENTNQQPQLGPKKVIDETVMKEKMAAISNAFKKSRINQGIEPESPDQDKQKEAKEEKIERETIELITSEKFGIKTKPSISSTDSRYLIPAQITFPPPQTSTIIKADGRNSFRNFDARYIEETHLKEFKFDEIDVNGNKVKTHTVAELADHSWQGHQDSVRHLESTPNSSRLVDIFETKGNFLGLHRLSVRPENIAFFQQAKINGFSIKEGDNRSGEISVYKNNKEIRSIIIFGRDWETELIQVIKNNSKN